MKKLIVGILAVVGFTTIASAGQDKFGSPRPAVWRSSVTFTNDSNVLVASAPVIVHAVTVDTPGSGSNVELFDTSVSSVGATRPTAPLDTTSKNANPEWNVICSSGLIYNTSGATPAKITILWDYVIRPNWAK